MSQVRIPTAELYHPLTSNVAQPGPTTDRLELLAGFHLLERSLLELSDRRQAVYPTGNGPDDLAGRFARSLLGAQMHGVAV